MIDIEYVEVIDNICFLVLECMWCCLFVEFVEYLRIIDDFVFVM